MNDARQVRPSRRGFMKTGIAAAGTALAAPAVIPGRALGKSGQVAPSEKIVMGSIGIGGRGTHDLNWSIGQKDTQYVAVCDVREERRYRAKALVDKRYKNKDCATYLDMGEFLAARQDIDAVVIATGDRWHATAAIMAMRSGKDIYCEKPSSMTVAEGRAVVDTADRFARVYQTGTQRLTQPNFIFPTQLALRGKLGELHTLRAHLWPRVRDVTVNDWLPAEPEPTREKLNWDAWLGPVPWRPYNKRYLGGCGAWGVYWDFAAGIAGWGAHTIVQCQAAAGLEYTSPVHYAYPGNTSGDGMVCRFANGIKLVLCFECGWRGTCGVRYEGSEGWASVADGYARPDLSSPSLLAEYNALVKDHAAKHCRSLDHMRDFLDCVKSRRKTVANPAVMHRSMTANHAVNICLLLGRDLQWDPNTERFVDDPEANRLLSRAPRAPWIV